MNIFLSYSSRDRAAAEAVNYALLGAKHEVFFDRSALPPGGDYHAGIQDAIAACELFVFLITPDSVRHDSFALTELEAAHRRWPHPKNRVLPVLLTPTAMDAIPAYLKAVTLLEPIGNAPAEVLAAVARLARASRPLARLAAVAGAAAALLVVALSVYHFGDFGGGSADAEAAVNLPNPLQLRFSYRPPNDGAVPLDKTLRINLVANRRVFDAERLAEQAGGFYSYNAPYPTEERTMRGSLVSQVLDARRENRDLASRFCLTRPRSLQAFKDLYMQLDCPAGADCEVGELSPRWLERCPAEPARTGQGFSLFGTAFAAEAGKRRWVVPSAKTLQSHPERLKEVGYTVFDISTDAFRDAAIIGIEVGVAVNGEAVDEDGLAPSLRPLPNDPAAPFKYRFALQSLNFQGQQGGCDAVRLSLRPLRSDGKPGPEQAVTLAYVALRSTAEEVVALGPGKLRWSANYVVPPAEWSHVALFRSFPFKADDAAAAAAQRGAANDAKRRFDALKLSYKGQPLVAVIRPPLTQTGGSLAYGLAAGIVEASGQIRFSFSSDEANRIGDALLAARTTNKEAAGLIATAKYPYKVAGSAERRERLTPAGLCSHIQPG